MNCAMMFCLLIVIGAQAREGEAEPRRMRKPGKKG